MKTLVLHYEKLIYLNTKVCKKYGGSTYDYNEKTDKFVKIHQSVKKSEKPVYQASDFGEDKPFDVPDWYVPSLLSNNYNFELSDDEPEILNTKEKQVKPHKLNKKKIREKLTAYFFLPQSKNFLAFFSISFPYQTPDDTAYKIFNNVLSRCRKNLHLKSYLWVAERQSNGTIHFHLVTNNYMYIRYVNHYVKAALHTEQKNGLECLQPIKDKDGNIHDPVINYNGVDVKRVENNQKRIACYITKYISKNTIEFYRAAWNCSKSISALFTHEYFDYKTEKEYINNIRNSIKKYTTEILDFDYCTIENVHVKQKNGNYPYIKCSSIDNINIVNYILYNTYL